MKQPTYQQALSKAWQMTWRHKNLWVLGLLAAFLGQFGLGDFFGRIWMLYYHGTISGISGYFIGNYGFSFGNMSAQNILGMVWLIILLALIFITVVFVAVSSQGALIIYAASWYRNRFYKDFGNAWHAAVVHFWPMFKAVVLYKIVLAAIIAAGLGLLILGDKSNIFWIDALCGIIIGVLLFVFLVLSILYIYTIGYIVIDNNKVCAAFQKAWNLFSVHLLVSLEVGLLMTLFNLILIVMAAAVLILALVPATVIWVASGIMQTASLAVIGFKVALFSWIIMTVFIAAVFNCFNISVWTYLFIKMHQEGILSRTIHFFSRIFSRL